MPEWLANTLDDRRELIGADRVTRRAARVDHPSGLATAVYELALAHALEREQFGQPIAGFQLVQDKLSRMLAEITSMQLMCWRLSKLADAGRMTAAMASLAKMNHAAKARAIVADARDILGGDGILLDNHVARHHADMEAIFTFEGTDSVQALIVGREITGLSAISGRKPDRLGSPDPRPRYRRAQGRAGGARAVEPISLLVGAVLLAAGYAGRPVGTTSLPPLPRR